MGKVKRARQKAHTAAVKVKQDKSFVNKDEVEVVEMNPDLNLPPGLTHEEIVQSNLFDGLDMSKYNITTKLPDFDARSAITSKSLKGLNLKKKEKQKLRHDLWLQKLNAIDQMKKKAKEKKQKEQTPVVGDIGALGDALPTLDLLLKKSTGPVKQSEPKKRGIEKVKKRKKQMLDDISLFHQVVRHQAFKDNPVATISEHLHNRQKQEDMDDS